MIHPILIPAPTAPAALVVADPLFLAGLADAESAAHACTIHDAASAQEAGHLLRQLEAAAGELRRTRRGLKQPLRAACRQIDATTHGLESRLERARARVRRLLGDWSADGAARRPAPPGSFAAVAFEILAPSHAPQGGAATAGREVAP